MLFLAVLFAAQFQQQIVVTAERGDAPVEDAVCAVTVLAPESIPAVSAQDVLTTTPGFAFFSNTLAARGFYGGGEVDYMQLRVDGVPIADVESNVAPWQQFRAEEVERVEVVRAVASPLYGDAALGGVVQLFTRGGDATSATLTRGSFGTSDVTASVFAGDFSAFGEWSETDGERPHASAERRGARVRWRRTGARAVWDAVADWREGGREDAGPLPLEEIESGASDERFASDSEQTARRQVAISVQNGQWNASVFATDKANEATRTILVLPPFADTASRELDSGELGASAQWTSGDWRAGVDGAKQRFDVDWHVAKANVRRDVRAAWGTKHVRMSDKLMLTGSLRVDDIDDATAWSPRLGVVAKWRGASVYGSAGRGFKAPTLEQLYDVRPRITISNPDLEPQRARSLEAGARGGRWAVDGYLIRVTNEIDFDPSTFRYGNIARSEHRGFEALWDARPLRLTYAWSRVFSLDDPARAQLKNIPQHSATAMLIARLPRGIDASALFVWNGGRFYDDAERIAAPDTRSLSLRVQKEFGAVAIRLDVFNALNAHNAGLGYALPSVTGDLAAFAIPEARRSVRVGVRWQSHRSGTRAGGSRLRYQSGGSATALLKPVRGDDRRSRE